MLEVSVTPDAPLLINNDTSHAKPTLTKKYEPNGAKILLHITETKFNSNLIDAAHIKAILTKNSIIKKATFKQGMM